MREERPADAAPADLVLTLRHTGERLELRRLGAADGPVRLRIRGSIPAGEEGPPEHIHVLEDEEGRVLAGTLSGRVDGKDVRIPAGQTLVFPRGVAHRWWNEGDEELRFEGFASPVVDLDRYLQAMFEVLNAGPEGRPPLFHLAHALHRHRRTQVTLAPSAALPRMIFRRVAVPLLVLIGALLGKYRGTEWPGCPARCRGAPDATAEAPAP